MTTPDDRRNIGDRAEDLIRGVARLYERAAIGPVPGQVVLLIGLLFHASWYCSRC